MKMLIFLATFTLLSAFNIIAQTPKSFKYQAVARNTVGEVYTNKNLSFQISILADSINGTEVYIETHNVVSNQFGVVNIDVGSGTVVSGDFSAIDWSARLYFLKTEMDTAGGNDFQLMGISQLLSVPYSLNSERTEGVTVVDSVSHLNDISAPFVGRIVFVLERELLYIWNGNSWKKFGCYPMPTEAVVGNDTLIYGDLNTPFNFTLQGNTPQFGTGVWTLLSGSDGVIDNPTDPVSNFTGTYGNSYTLRWTITTDCDSTYDQFGIYSYGSCGLLTDTRDGKVYQTVKIDTMCWMAENLNYGTRIDGSVDQTDNSVAEKYCYDDDETNCDVYGGLYQWNEVMQYDTLLKVQGICPDGWHIPSNSEWQVLSNLVGGNSVSGGKMKEAGFEHWNQPNTGAVNSFGFTAIPGGNRYFNGGAFFSMGNTANFWTSSKSNSSNAWRRKIETGYAELYQSSFNKNYGFSLRCLKD